MLVGVSAHHPSPPIWISISRSSPTEVESERRLLFLNNTPIVPRRVDPLKIMTVTLLSLGARVSLEFFVQAETVRGCGNLLVVLRL